MMYSPPSSWSREKLLFRDIWSAENSRDPAAVAVTLENNSMAIAAAEMTFMCLIRCIIYSLLDRNDLMA
jgi:hypothetical protein